MYTAAELANAKGVAEHAAAELHTLLIVYGASIPPAVAESMTKLQASLASVAKVAQRSPHSEPSGRRSYPARRYSPSPQWPD